MQSGKALLVGLGFLGVALAGCSSSPGAADGFVIKHDGGSTYTFTASGGADNYTWDLGDRLTQLYGKKVTHTYDFDNGKVNVVLVSKKGTTPTEARKELTLGTGENSQATFILEGSRNWTVKGETLTLSAAASTDPDGDPLRYSWSCVRTGPAVRTATHAHGFGNAPYATPPAGTVTARVAIAPLGTPDVTYEGDLCEALGSGGRPALTSTIAGKFTNTGVYDIYLLASDPVHPSTSGKFHFVVTDPSERPNATTVWTFNGTLQGGTGGTLQEACTVANQCGGAYDTVDHPFSLSLGGLAGKVKVAKVSDAAASMSTLNWTLYKGSNTPVANGGAGDERTIPPAMLAQGGYHLKIDLDAGLDVDYLATVTIEYDMDPFKVY